MAKDENMGQLVVDVLELKPPAPPMPDVEVFFHYDKMTTLIDIYST